MKIPEGHISTYTGRIINPLEPDPEQINLLDICHHLSNICRFSGATRNFYSVGEHTCRVHDIVADEHKLAALLHDASEYLLIDLARPVKHSEEMKFFREIEDQIMKIIYEKFGVEEVPEIKEADQILLITEQRDLMPWQNFWVNGTYPLEQRITPWFPGHAKYAMIERFEKLGIEVKR